MTSEPTITYKKVTTHTLTIHLASLTFGRRSSSSWLTRCGRFLGSGVVDETTENVNCKSCLKLAEKDAR